MAGPLRGGGGKGRAINFYILLPFKNKNYFTLDNLSKYGNITLKFVGRYFYLLVTIFSKKLVQKLWGEKKISKSVFGYLKTKKKNKLWPRFFFFYKMPGVL